MESGPQEKTMVTLFEMDPVIRQTKGTGDKALCSVIPTILLCKRQTEITSFSYIHERQARAGEEAEGASKTTIVG